MAECRMQCTDCGGVETAHMNNTEGDISSTERQCTACDKVTVKDSSVLKGSAHHTKLNMSSGKQEHLKNNFNNLFGQVLS